MARGDGPVKRTRKGARRSDLFWNDEYKKAGHLAMSNNPSEDLARFTRFLEREYGRLYLNPLASVLDLGCGNGRNMIYLSENFGLRGIGYDNSAEAIFQAKKMTTSKALPLTYETRSIAGVLDVPDNSQTFVLDMMASHFLNNAEREVLFREVMRVLKPGGWYFFKTFLLDEDDHAKRLLMEHPGSEAGAYIHPEIGVEEHVFSQDEITDMLEKHFFTIYKMFPSHKHRLDGKANKRRSISVYAQKS